MLEKKKEISLFKFNSVFMKIRLWFRKTNMAVGHMIRQSIFFEDIRQTS